MIIRAVEPGRSVHAESAAREFLRGEREILRSLEHQMLKEMRHAGFSVGLIPGAHFVRHIDGGSGF